MNDPLTRWAVVMVVIAVLATVGVGIVLIRDAVERRRFRRIFRETRRIHPDTPVKFIRLDKRGPRL